MLALVAAGHGKDRGRWRWTDGSVLSTMPCSSELDGECGHGDEYGGGGVLRPGQWLQLGRGEARKERGVDGVELTERSRKTLGGLGAAELAGEDLQHIQGS